MTRMVSDAFFSWARAASKASRTVVPSWVAPPVIQLVAREAMRLAIHKLPFKACFIKREAGEI